MEEQAPFGKSDYEPNLRAAVTKRYQESIDFSTYEPKIKKLIDAHVGAGEVEQLTPRSTSWMLQRASRL